MMKIWTLGCGHEVEGEGNILTLILYYFFNYGARVDIIFLLTKYVIRITCILFQNILFTFALYL